MACRIGPMALAMVLLTWLCVPAWGAFDPSVLGKSTVRITIKEGDVVRSAASGFAWQDPTHIVTSLHVMHHGADAQVVVEFAGRSRRAQVIGVLPKADLVLLQIDRPIEGLVALTRYQGDKPPYQAPIHALGYNAGASGSMTRELHKGHADPEILKQLLPPKDRAELAAAKIPDIELDIYYLDGSLLPGFSGSPVVDAEGELIGIGNGGLENGASNVSWVIPARFLDELTASRVTTLPTDLAKAQQSFSADLDVTEDYQEIVFDDFVFVKTKTRTFAELASSSDSPSDLREVGSLTDELGYTVDLDALEFDIYEDLKHGIIITLPKDIALLVGSDDQGSPALQADYFGQHDNSYSITFYLAPLEEAVDPGEDIELALNEIADFYLEYLNEAHVVPLVEVPDVRETEEFGGDRYILRTLFHDFDGDVNSHEMDYVTIATNLEFMFVAQGELDRFDTYFEPLRLAHMGTDCRAQGLDSEQEEVCDEMRVMLQILTSVHLTTFANAKTVEEESPRSVPASITPQDSLPEVDPGTSTVEELPHFCCTAVGALGPYANPGPNGAWPLELGAATVRRRTARRIRGRPATALRRAAPPRSCRLIAAPRWARSAPMPIPTPAAWPIRKVPPAAVRQPTGWSIRVRHAGAIRRPAPPRSCRTTAAPRWARSVPIPIPGRTACRCRKAPLARAPLPTGWSIRGRPAGAMWRRAPPRICRTIAAPLWARSVPIPIRGRTACRCRKAPPARAPLPTGWSIRGRPATDRRRWPCAVRPARCSRSRPGPEPGRARRR